MDEILGDDEVIVERWNPPRKQQRRQPAISGSWELSFLESLKSPFAYLEVKIG